MTTEQAPPPRRVGAFETITVAAARAQQLLRGCQPRVDGSAKPARLALQEVTSGKVAAAEPDPAPDDPAPDAGEG